MTAPVTGVCGNNDIQDWAEAIPDTQALQIGGVSIYMLHDLKTINIDPSAAVHHVVISGHSHKPSIETRDGVIYLNSGSAGPRRFKLPVSVAILKISGSTAVGEIIELFSVICSY